MFKLLIFDIFSRKSKFIACEFLFGKEVFFYYYDFPCGMNLMIFKFELRGTIDKQGKFYYIFQFKM